MTRLKSQLHALLDDERESGSGSGSDSATPATTKNYRIVTYILVILFASCSWINVNCVWTELSPMVIQLPESWGLPAYLTIIVQLAIIGPLTYGIVKKTCLKSRSLDTSWFILWMIVVETVITILLAFFWRSTAFFGGQERSFALLALFFTFSLVDSTSNLVFLPYMSIYRPIYVTAYFIGMSVSGLVPSLVGLVQGAGRTECVLYNQSNPNSTGPKYVEPLFGVRDFYLMMFAWMIIALVAFILLHWTKLGKLERIDQFNEPMEKTAMVKDIDGKDKPFSISNGHYYILLGVTAWACALSNGILPSIQSYAALNYGQNTFHMSVILPNLVQPLVSLIPNWFSLRSISITLTLAFTGSLLAAYLIYLAVISPLAILQFSVIGSIICVAIWIASKAVLTYLRAAIGDTLNRAQGSSESRLFWLGVATQLGSFTGAIIIFPMVNIYNVFQSAPLC